MNEDTYFFDTYALFSILEKNPDYVPYLEKKVIINDFVFAEFCYNLFKDKARNAQTSIDEIKDCVVHADPEWIKEAMQFRLDWKDRNVSMADCIGYIMAKQLGIKFLTGDKEFEGMENVEFVK